MDTTQARLLRLALRVKFPGASVAGFSDEHDDISHAADISTLLTHEHEKECPDDVRWLIKYCATALTGDLPGACAAAIALCNLSGNGAMKPLVMEYCSDKSIANVLFRFATTSNKDDLIFLPLCLRSVVNMLGAPPASSAALFSQVMPMLIASLGTNDSEFFSWTCRALAYVSELDPDGGGHEYIEAIMVSPGAVREIVSKVVSEKGVQEQLMWCIANLASGTDTHSSQVIACGGVDLALLVLERCGADTNCVGQAVAALFELSNVCSVGHQAVQEFMRLNVVEYCCRMVNEGYWKSRDVQREVVFFMMSTILSASPVQVPVLGSHAVRQLLSAAWLIADSQIEDESWQCRCVHSMLVLHALNPLVIDDECKDYLARVATKYESCQDIVKKLLQSPISV